MFTRALGKQHSTNSASPVRNLKAIEHTNVPVQPLHTGAGMLITMTHRQINEDSAAPLHVCIAPSRVEPAFMLINSNLPRHARP